MIEMGDAMSSFLGPEPPGIGDVRLGSLGALISQLSVSAPPGDQKVPSASPPPSTQAPVDSSSSSQSPPAASVDIVLEAFDQYMRWAGDAVLATLSHAGRDWAAGKTAQPPEQGRRFHAWSASITR